MVNKVFLSGFVGKEPTITNFENGGQIAVLSVATTERGYTTKEGTVIPERTEWHSVVLKGHLATFAGQYVHKGDKVAVVGKLTYRNWQDKDGGKHVQTEIVCEEIDLTSRK